MPTVLESLNTALHHAFTDHEQVYLVGEDLLDPYGGAFKVGRGLSTRFPSRVLTTPISEAGFVGLAAGMALRGLRPVVEIMFGDFITLVADQLINQISKFRWMYNHQVRLPIVIRCPMGGRRGYGPTHSQTLEKLFLGIPGLQVVAPAAFQLAGGAGSPGALLYDAIIHNDDPLLFIENKLQYLMPVQSQAELSDFNLTTISSELGDMYPTYNLSVRGAPPATLTIACYGYIAELVKQAASILAYEQEIFCEVVVPTRLAPFDVQAVTSSARHSGALMTVEEGSLSLGWGSEVVSRVAEAPETHGIRFMRIAAREVPIPASGPLEEQALPQVRNIVESAVELHRNKISQLI
jgi:pyruvate/2-oxoglutarate/acetoin dehydrogenase E1 component